MATLQIHDAVEWGMASCFMYNIFKCNIFNLVNADITILNYEQKDSSSPTAMRVNNGIDHGAIRRLGYKRHTYKCT